MTALLIIAHGSRREASNKEVSLLTDRLRQHAAESHPLIEYGFLELSEPKVSAVIEALAARGATHIQVFPHFLAAGTHVTHDIPREIETAKEKYPDIQFDLLPHLGSLQELPSLIFNLSRNR